MHQFLAEYLQARSRVIARGEKCSVNSP